MFFTDFDLTKAFVYDIYYLKDNKLMVTKDIEVLISAGFILFLVNKNGSTDESNHPGYKKAIK